MMLRKPITAAFLFLFVLFLLNLSGCPMYTAVAFKYAKAGGSSSEGGSSEGAAITEDPAAVNKSADSITLAWDPPPSAVAKYRVFFRIHDTSTWYSLEDNLTAESEPEYTVQHEDVNSGIFDFGVVAVNSEALESNMHQSLENTAQPETGWYLIWE